MLRTFKENHITFTHSISLREGAPIKAHEYAERASVEYRGTLRESTPERTTSHGDQWRMGAKVLVSAQ